MKRKLLSLALALAMGLSLSSCGGGAADTAGKTEEAAEGGTEQAAVETLKIACSAVPHAEILDLIKPDLAEQGIDLQITVYGDYVVPNTAVEEGAEDVNFFQHRPYLDNFNTERGTHLVDVAGIHVEPMGIYGGKAESLEGLSDGASVAVPNDPTNEGRALLLLEAQGLLTLKEDAGLNATPNDIADNPHNLTFTEVEAAMLPNILSEVDYAVINVNYALEGGLNPLLAPDGDALAIENADSPYVNVIVVKEGNENDARVLALVNALQSDTVRDFINEKYGGSVVATF